MRILVAALVASLVIACGDDDGGGPRDAGTDGAVADTGPGPGPATARFQLPGTGAIAWGEVPFPSDLYLGADGTVDLGTLPATRGAREELVAAIADALSVKRGFCATCNAFFLIDGQLDPASVPAPAGPGDAASADDPIVLMDVDDASPDRGTSIPVRVEWVPSLSRLAVLPARGFAPRQNRRYAVAITSALRASDGSALAPSPLFAAVRDGGMPAGVDAAAVERARTVVEPALVALAAGGVARARVVAVAAFTTQPITDELRAARALVHAQPVQVATVDRVWPNATTSLDDLLGIPVENRPGRDVPNMPGTEGTRAYAHETVQLIISGTLPSPRVVSGAGSEIGTLRRDAAGALAAGPEPERVPFLLTIPMGADLRNLPVLVEQHGFTGTRADSMMLADTVGRAGVAMLAVDAFQHGARAASAVDEVNDFRGGIPGADGIAEHTIADVQSRAFGLSGTPDGLALFPGYPLATFVQFVTDIQSAVRFVREGDLSAIRDADPALRMLSFDPDRVMYLGQSMGAVIGAGVLMSEESLGAVVLNVPPGALVEVLTEAYEFRSLSDSVLFPILGVSTRFDEVTRHAVHDPIIDLYRWIVEPFDPLALSPYFLREPVAAGPRPDVLWQLASLDQLAAPPATESMLASAGVPAGGEGVFTFAALDPLPALPVSANVMTPSGPVTAAAWQYHPATHGALDNEMDDSAADLPLIPPFQRREMPIDVTNPIREMHGQITRFLTSEVADGTAEID